MGERQTFLRLATTMAMEQLAAVLSSAGVDPRMLELQLDRELCLSLRVAAVVAVAAVTVLVILLNSRRKEKIHILDFAVHKPSER